MPTVMSTAALAFRSESSSNRYLLGLVWTLVRTDFKTRYHGTIQGFLWALAKPLMMFLVLMGVFSFIFAAEPAYRLAIEQMAGALHKLCATDPAAGEIQALLSQTRR